MAVVRHLGFLEIRILTADTIRRVIMRNCAIRAIVRVREQYAKLQRPGAKYAVAECILSYKYLRSKVKATAGHQGQILSTPSHEYFSVIWRRASFILFTLI